MKSRPQPTAPSSVVVLVFHSCSLVEIAALMEWNIIGNNQYTHRHTHSVHGTVLTLGISRHSRPFSKLPTAPMVRCIGCSVGCACPSCSIAWCLPLQVFNQKNMDQLSKLAQADPRLVERVFKMVGQQGRFCWASNAAGMALHAQGGGVSPQLKRMVSDEFHFLLHEADAPWDPFT